MPRLDVIVSAAVGQVFFAQNEEEGSECGSHRERAGGDPLCPRRLGRDGLLQRCNQIVDALEAQVGFCFECAEERLADGSGQFAALDFTR